VTSNPSEDTNASMRTIQSGFEVLRGILSERDIGERKFTIYNTKFQINSNIKYKY
jgi:hypothetical protein